MVLAAGCAVQGAKLVDSGGSSDAPAADLTVGGTPVDASADLNIAMPATDAADATNPTDATSGA
ncbi:MAG TPA: hypothetical protein VGL59_23405, partial [Polyangia bacterium]